MPPRPADLYLALHDDGPVLAATSPARRLAALVFAVLLLAAVPLVWADNALATTGPKAAIAHDGDDDNSGPGGGDDDDEDSSGPGSRGDDSSGTATNSNTATRTGDTGVSTKQPTATASVSATATGKTGVSTQG